MRKIISCFVLLVLTVNAWSYNERGNSGFSVICENPEDNKFYDAYEAEERYNLKPKFPEYRNICEGGDQCMATAQVIARRFFRRLPDDTPIKKYAMERLYVFMLEISIKDQIEILPVNDAGIGFIPKDCKLRQTIVQREPIFPEDMRYIISNDYWKLLSTEQKAVGIVHEILYGYYAELKIEASSSEKIRYLNALIISGQIETYSELKFKRLIEQVYSK